MVSDEVRTALVFLSSGFTHFCSGRPSLKKLLRGKVRSQKNDGVLSLMKRVRARREVKGMSKTVSV